MKQLLLTVFFIWTFSVVGAEPKSQCPVEFYAGVSVGWDHFIAKQTEQLTTRNEQLFFSNNKTQRANGINGKIIAGFLWTVPTTAFVLSPEIYIGRSSAEVTLQKGIINAADEQKGFQRTFKQSLAIGAVLRAGFYLTDKQNDLLYILCGIDHSQFENKFTLFSTDVAGDVVPPLFEKRKKTLKSTIIGFGFEKKFNRLKIGIDLRYMPYSAWDKYAKTALISEDVISIRFKPKVISTSLTFCYLF